jgi:P-type E1-E2 ATPase
MIELDVPGRGKIELEHLVCDVNGTLAVDGILLEGVPRGINGLRDRLAIHLLTADTHQKQAVIDYELRLKAIRIQPGNEAAQKAAYVEQLGPAHVIAFGQGANDTEMLKLAAIGVCIVSQEGSAVEALQAADLVVPDIRTAFELLEKPMRIIASLRK